jgi:xanthine dehydrogenase large subunit
MAAIGKDIPHDSARGHVSGQSTFIDDITPARNEVLVEPLGSPVAHGRIKSIDTSEALKIGGVLAIFTHRDIPGHNRFGPIV